ncbi:DUF3944 domain-containing protein [Vibrio parahaemolyticus]|uniref:DUF3944 domain-containing protein n=1 Tax=Vibrio parahaemolyticus TaxID=670 RepID=UPI000401E6D8|nr:DUF3944 domain-containing protein [Vibrio parahaemolyticus]EJG0871432.1 DUF3944 domain-containing protein [Vibrio parahaemolyticus O3]EJG0900091.1 DUF3944 domain-containing protein [Vibrio parahaemolyticus O3:K56]EJG1072942.1 DUF3944 domain-containing protein [Vibrio parahaemolyticus O1:K56]ELC9579244.1 DUF3944 domain-containing protein [Vibrio vulnificus]KIT25479.1 hypothetical protein H323_07085 [Vibrio parahaemolyticus VP766]
MANNYRDDQDLAGPLQYASNDMLEVLVQYLTKNPKGQKRFTEQLTIHPEFVAANGDLTKAWRAIAAEIQYYGGDSVANMVRRKGTLYRDILKYVCKKQKVKADFKNDPVVDIEKKLISKLFEDMWEKLDSKQRELIAQELELDTTKTGPETIREILKQLDSSNHNNTVYSVSMILASSYASSLLGSLGALSSRTFLMFGSARVAPVFAGPIGIALAAYFTLASVTGPAYRITLPCVVQIAAMRQQMLKPETDLF